MTLIQSRDPAKNMARFYLIDARPICLAALQCFAMDDLEDVLKWRNLYRSRLKPTNISG